MGENPVRLAELERRIEYLSVQVERLIDLQRPFPSPLIEFRKAAMLSALTFEQEALVQKLLGAVHAFNNGNEIDVNTGLLPFSQETIALFDAYAAQGAIAPDQVKDMLKTIVPGGDVVAEDLLNAWEVAQATIRRNDREL